MSHALTKRLFAPTDIASLVFFRILFGAVMLWEVWTSFSSGRIRRDFIDPSFHFTYSGFSWIKPWPADGMFIHFFILGGLALLILVGLFYRLSMALFVLAYAYLFLLDQSLYQNHGYLVLLLGSLMIFLPAHRVLSVDVWLKPGLRTESISAWPLWLLRGQIFLVILFAAVSMMNADWVSGDAIRGWLSRRSDVTVAGPLIPAGRFLAQPWLADVIAWGALAINLLALPCLLWRRARLVAFITLAALNLINARLFGDIGLPWLMIAATALFFAPNWPRQLFNWPRKEPIDASEIAPIIHTPFEQRKIITLLAAYLLVQTVIPLRHFLYAGSVNWTEEGHRFAWRQRVRHKNTQVSLTATDPATGEKWPVNPADYLAPHQLNPLKYQPELVLQLAHHVSEVYREQGRPGIEVRATAPCSLNGHERALLIDPTVNLAAQPRTLAPAPWIMPQKQTPALANATDE